MSDAWSRLFDRTVELIQSKLQLGVIDDAFKRLAASELTQQYGSTLNPHERLAAHLEAEMGAVDQLIRERMASRHAPRIPEVTAHLIDAGGKRIRPMLTLAAANLCVYKGEGLINLAATVEFIHTATLLHDASASIGIRWLAPALSLQRLMRVPGT